VDRQRVHPVRLPGGLPLLRRRRRLPRNLSADEIVGSVRFLLGLHPDLVDSCPKLKVHLARIGEPSLNDAVPEAIGRIRALTTNPGLWCCLPTVVPAGRERFFDRLLEAKEARFPGRFQLQFSLNTTDAAARGRITPVRLAPFDEIARIGRRFYRSDRRPVLNFALAADLPFDPDALPGLFEPETFAVKLTPLNPTAEGDAHGLVSLADADRACYDRHIDRLLALGYETVVSIGDPRENLVGSNCGQAIRRMATVAGMDTAKPFFPSPPAPRPSPLP
jgi:23S rRNA (adenine2503-C2)-methyltransferase